MADKNKAGSSKETLEDLASKKEAIEELTEDAAQAVQGGMRKAGGDPQATSMVIKTPIK
jgi:hypothetical protein